jgi:hypothetical protein
MATELDVSLTHKYEPLITTRQQNLFTEEFFAGPDVSISLNGLEQQNISQIQYTVQEQLKPIYGYDSMVFDDIAVGSRIVVGTFTMPVYNTSSNDSLTTLERLSKRQENLPSWVVTSHSKTPVVTTRFEANPKISQTQRLLNRNGYQVKETGVMDDATYRAMTDYQQKEKISSVGEVTDELIMKLKVSSGEAEAFSSGKDLILRIKPYPTALICGTIEARRPYVILLEEAGWCYVSSMSGIKGYVPLHEVKGGN